MTLHVHRDGLIHTQHITLPNHLCQNSTLHKANIADSKYIHFI